MAASPGDRRFASNPETGRHGTGADVGQASGPARPRPVRQGRSSTGFAGTRLAARLSGGSLAPSRGRAKAGGTLLTPTPVEHPAAPPSIPSKGMPPGEGTFPFPAVVPEPLSPPRRASRPQCRQALGVEQVRDEQHPVVI